MDRFTDEDGDEWTRGEEQGQVVCMDTTWRYVTNTVIEWKDYKNNWHQESTDDRPVTARCMSAAIAALWPETTCPESTTPSIVDAPTPRRIIQLAFSNPLLAALCDDGTAWTIHDDSGGVWKQLPPIPQGDQ